jgi:hypothetical protein
MMRAPGHRYDLVFRPAAAKPHMLRPGLTADEATVAFADEMRRLREGRVEGELAVRQCHDGQALVLRQPLGGRHQSGPCVG